jgi:hypothetical protein
MWRAHDRLSQTTQAAWEKSRKNIRTPGVRDPRLGIPMFMGEVH